MKLKEFFTKRGQQGKITDEAFTKYLETIPDVDVPDEIDKVLEKAFMTTERALADSTIIGKARAEAYNAMDDRIAKIMQSVEKIDKTLVVDISNDKDTLAKISKLGPVLDKIAVKANGGEVVEQVKELEKQKGELLERIKVINSEKDETVNELKKGFESEKKSIILDHALTQKISQIEFADEHKELRGAIVDIALAKLKKDNHLSLDESGNIQVSTLENGVPKPKFNGNTQVTFEQVLEDTVKPYVKKNNTGGKEKPKETPKHTPTPSSTGDTVVDRRRAAYGG